MGFDFSIVTGKTVDEILQEDVPSCLRIIEAAYRTHGAGDSVNPNSYFIRFPDKPNARIIALPAYLGGDCNTAGLKWIGSYPDNVKRGFPRASAVLILNDYDTGYPFACLESSIISAARTAASAVVAAERLVGGRAVASLGIVGNGIIAKYVYRFLRAAGWRIPRVSLFDLNRADSEKFARGVLEADGGEPVETVFAKDAAELTATSELVLYTTTAGAPYLHDPALLSHNPVLLNVSLRDLSPELILASQNVVDDVGHVLNANTSVHLTEQRVGNRDFIHATLAQLLDGSRRVVRERPIVFSPFGLGVLDIALGKHVFDRARQRDQLIRIPDFFHELSR